MSKATRNAGIAAVVYILTIMWIFQNEEIDFLSRVFVAVMFFVVIAFTYLVSSDVTDTKKNKN